MHRRQFVQAVWALPASLWAGAADSVRGILEHAQGDQPVLRTPSGQRVVLEGDEDSLKVLRDKRLVGRELEILGTRLNASRFRAGPFYQKNILVIERGKKYLVTYWCDVCSIRSYTPGPCACCQQETQLDLRPVDSPP
jgi:hypothetical protein